MLLGTNPGPRGSVSCNLEVITDDAADPEPAHLAAQQADVLRWIMSAGGVVIPQSQARRAIALPPGLVSETIRAPVADTNRQLPQHTHRNHPTQTPCL